MPFDFYNNEHTDSSLYYDDFGDGDDRMEILRELDEDYDPMSDPDPFDDDEEWSEDDDRGAIREDEDDDYDDIDEDLEDDEHEDLPHEDDDDIDDCFNCDGSISDKGFTLLGDMDRRGLFV